MEIIKYDSPKTNTNSNTVLINSTVSVDNAKVDNNEYHKLWGLNFNGKQDVYGDITNAKNIISKGGNILTSCEEEVDENGKLNANGGSITANNVNVKSTTLTDGTVCGGNATVDGNITTSFLTVTKKAHFFELLIDEIKSVGGLIILSLANATIDLVETTDTTYRCYFKAKDSDNKEIHNQFAFNDLVICQTFNTATGTSYDSSNKYYWRLVTEIGDATKTINSVSTECHYIDLSKTDCDTNSSIPEVGDKIALLGNRTDATRLAAIIMSSYLSQDTTVEAPSIVQYSGINDYKLSTHKLNQIAKNGNIFKGDYNTSTGDNIKGLIDNNTSLISLTANNITLKIKNTGLNIDDGTITLDAKKTNIKGNLSISQYTNGEGLTIYDSDNIPRIILRTDNMSDMTKYVDGQISNLELSGSYNINYAVYFGFSESNYEESSQTYPLGTFKAGDSISLKKMFINHPILHIYYMDGTDFYANTSILKLDYTMYLVKDNTTSTIIHTESNLTLDNTNTINIPDYISTAEAGDYSIKIDYKATLLQKDHPNYVPNIEFNCTVIRNTQLNIVLAQDGMAINCGADKWLYVSDTEILFRWKNEGIKLSNGGILSLYKKSDDSVVWSAYNKKHIKYVNNTTYTLDDVSDYIILGGNSSTLIIEKDLCIDGRTVKVKDFCSGYGYINFRGTPLVACAYNTKNTDTNKNVELDGNHLREYTYSADLDAWVEGYLSIN